MATGFLHGQRSVEVTAPRGGWLLRAAITAASLVLAVLGFVLLSSILAVIVCVAIVAALGVYVRSWVARQRLPNGRLDQRRNVRVVRPRDAGDE